MSILTSRGWHRSVAALPLFLIGLIADAGCHDTGAGAPPPLDELYFPVGLQVSHGGSVLYAVNSNFDIRYNGGTLQSYDLRLLRRHALLAIADPSDPTLPLLRPSSPARCPSSPPISMTGEPERERPTETCARQADSKVYYRDSAVIGAIATDLLLSLPPSELQGDFVQPNALPRASKVHADDAPVAAGTSTTDRLFLSVRGNSTLTWATVERDNFQSAPNPADTKATYAPFRIGCGQDPASNRCDVAHQVGADSNERDTGHIRMPGSPERLAISEDGKSLVVTHQSDTKTTLFSTGLSRTSGDDAAPPSIQNVADEVPFGGIGIASVPHDPDAFLGAREMPRPAFLQTSRAVAELTLIRRYSDEDDGVVPSVRRPFLQVEASFPITVSASGVDSRGIAIDPTPRLSCKARVAAVGQAMTVEQRDLQMKACARKPARVFIANRSPAALLIGEVGAGDGADDTYDPDSLTIHTSVPLSAGPSRVYLAPIVDRDGAYALRVFVLSFDSATLHVYDPDTVGGSPDVIRVAPGPSAMAFDPFSLEEVATHAQVPFDDRDGALGLRRYRFAYLASFTESSLQVIDLDNAAPVPATYQKTVYTLGRRSHPNGS